MKYPLAITLPSGTVSSTLSAASKTFADPVTTMGLDTVDPGFGEVTFTKPDAEVGTVVGAAGVVELVVVEDTDIDGLVDVVRAVSVLVEHAAARIPAPMIVPKCRNAFDMLLTSPR